MRLLLCSPLFLLSSAWLAHGGPNTSTTPDWYIAEREGLEELYDSTGGPGWLRQRGWKQPWSCHCTDWQGITCGKCRNQWGGGCDHSNSTIDPVTGCRIERVSNIQMGSNNLTGTTLPRWGGARSRGAFSSLEYLRIASNHLSGATLPSEWAALASLKMLDLTGNKFVGMLPSEWAALVALKDVSLEENKISGTLPPSWCSMVSLTSLSLSSNALISGSLPPKWAGMRALQLLYLMNNKLDGSLPSHWAAMTSLKALSLNYNKLSGSLQKSWGTLPELRSLSMEANRLTGTLPPEWASWSLLQSMTLEENALAGALPPAWANMSSLTSLRLQSNSFEGSLPASWASWARLQYLHLNRNSLSGTLPFQWGTFDRLMALQLNQNRLSGSLPNQWSKMTTLATLDLNNNRFTSGLPPSWAAMTLKTLNLGSNSLVGTLPVAWSNGPLLQGLKVLFLNNNRLSGSIKSSWWPNSSTPAGTAAAAGAAKTLPGGQLQVFDARSNHLTGSIPSSLLNSSAICILLLSDNQLTGLIDVLSPNFFEPFCAVMTTSFGSPFPPGLLLHNNRLSCRLPVAPTRATSPTGTPNAISTSRTTSKDALVACLAYEVSIFREGWADQCHALFQNSSAPINNSAMVISGNMFDGPLPQNWDNLRDPMWKEAPFLYFDRESWTNWVLPGFMSIVAYLCGGALLTALARTLLPQSRKWYDDGAGGGDGQKRINRRLLRVYGLGNFWLGAFSCMVLAVHLPAYISGARYFTCGDPLLRTTTAYLADSPTEAFVAVIGSVLVALLTVVLVVRLCRIVAQERDRASTDSNLDGRDETSVLDDVDDNSANDDRPWTAKASWAVAWFFGALILSAPTALYAITTAVPIDGSSQQVLLSIIHYGAPVYLTLVNSMAVPWLAKASSHRNGIPTSWLLLMSRLLSTWMVPATIIIFLDNSCGQMWVRFWDPCSNPESIRQMDVQGPNGFMVKYQMILHGQHYGSAYLANATYVDAKSEICLQRDNDNNNNNSATYHRTNSPQCARAVVAALAPLLLSKMAIQALAQPATLVLKWYLMPRGLWACLRRDKAAPPKTHIALDDIMAQVMTWLDLAIVFGPQVPLLAPLVLMAIAGQRWSMRVGLELLGKKEVRWNRSQPAVWSVVLSLVVQQILNVWLYQGEMVAFVQTGGDKNDATAAAAEAVRAWTWAAAAVTGVGLVAIGAWQAGLLHPWIARRLRGFRWAPLVWSTSRRRKAASSIVEMRLGDGSLDGADSNQVPLLEPQEEDQ